MADKSKSAKKNFRGQKKKDPPEKQKITENIEESTKLEEKVNEVDKDMETENGLNLEETSAHVMDLDKSMVTKILLKTGTRLRIGKKEVWWPKKAII